MEMETEDQRTTMALSQPEVVVEERTPHRKPPKRTRKRANKACMLCHARKVRCDVTVRNPCTKCQLDGEPCSARDKSQMPIRRAVNSRRVRSKTVAPAQLMAKEQYTCPDLEPLASVDKLDDCKLKDTTFDFQDVPPLSVQGPPSETSQSFCDDFGESTWGFPSSVSTDDITSTFRSSQPLPNSNPQGSPLISDPTYYEVHYCRYPFVVISNIKQIPRDDFNFLELQGCLILPIRPLLSTFVQQYFLHVHPTLPVVNEKDFWELYDGHETQEQSSQNTISLLLFQAMLFAASPFVPQSTVRALGYSSTRALRATLLRRAKLLYDLESEVSFLIIAQASILLSTASLSSSGKPNTMWLHLAIQNARIAEAHLYRTTPGVSDAKQRNTLKRLWWCCIIRDCSISLLLKRPIQITRENFDFVGDPLSAKDIEDEFDGSRVYSPPVKRKLAEILSLSTQLFLELIDTLLLIYPPSGKQPSIQQEVDSALLEIDEIKFGLEAWRSNATSVLQSHRSQAGIQKSFETDPESAHDSITLYTRLMYMYYHSARISLCHYQTLQLVVATSSGSFIARDPLRVSESRTEIRDAVSDLTECHKELLRFKLVQWMPHLAMGFSTLPLILHLLDARLAPVTWDSIPQSNSTSMQTQLGVLIEFMKVYCTRYESLDWITSIVHHVINFALLSPSITKDSTGTDWSSILADQPRSYLGLVFLLDISLNKGRLAHVEDIPAHLRGFIVLNLNDSKDLVASQGRVSKGSCETSSNQIVQASQFNASMYSRVQLQSLELDDCLINTLDSGFMFNQSTEDDSCPDQESSAQWLLEPLTMSVLKKKKLSYSGCTGNGVLEGEKATKPDGCGV